MYVYLCCQIKCQNIASFILQSYSFFNRAGDEDRLVAAVGSREVRSATFVNKGQVYLLKLIKATAQNNVPPPYLFLNYHHFRPYIWYSSIYVPLDFSVNFPLSEILLPVMTSVAVATPPMTSA